MVTTPVRIVVGDDSQWPSDPVRIANWTDFIEAVATALASGETEIQRLYFDTTPDAVAHTEGLVQWNDQCHTLDVYTDITPVVIQVGQELLIKVRNNSGAQIQDGSFVYVTGVVGNRPSVALAQANDATKIQILGAATNTIEHNQDGYICIAGLVRNLNTNTLAEARIYLSATVAGAVSNTPAVAPNFVVDVGEVLRSHLTQGVIRVNSPHPSVFGNITGGNYTAFEGDGTMVAVGDATCWRDELQSLIGQRLEAPGSDIVQNNAEGTLTFKTSATVTDYVVMNVQLNHDRKLGESVEVHVHWFQAQAAVPNFMIQWRWQANGAAKDTTWVSQIRTTSAFAYPGAGTIVQITEFGTIPVPAGGDGISDIIQIRLIRDANNASTLFTGADPVLTDVDAINLDCHIIVDTLGSRQEYAK